ncbi:hypothetical protein fHeYen902_186 [Yersinia phage fHe-Yen9-02]|nr:hypothetical protein fHeYen902_186 [Yersinia phage fHe-Yen9-02]
MINAIKKQYAAWQKRRSAFHAERREQHVAELINRPNMIAITCKLITVRIFYLDTTTYIFTEAKREDGLVYRNRVCLRVQLGLFDKSLESTQRAAEIQSIAQYISKNKHRNVKLTMNGHKYLVNHIERTPGDICITLQVL